MLHCSHRSVYVLLSLLLLWICCTAADFEVTEACVYSRPDRLAEHLSDIAKSQPLTWSDMADVFNNSIFTSRQPDCFPKKADKLTEMSMSSQGPDTALRFVELIVELIVDGDGVSELEAPGQTIFRATLNSENSEDDPEDQLLEFREFTGVYHSAGKDKYAGKYVITIPAMPLLVAPGRYNITVTTPFVAADKSESKTLNLTVTCATGGYEDTDNNRVCEDSLAIFANLTTKEKAIFGSMAVFLILVFLAAAYACFVRSMTAEHWMMIALQRRSKALTREYTAHTTSKGKITCCATSRGAADKYGHT